MGFRLRVPEHEGSAEVPEGTVRMQPNPARGKMEVIADVELQGRGVYDAQGKQMLAQLCGRTGSGGGACRKPVGDIYGQPPIIKKNLCNENSW